MAVDDLAKVRTRTGREGPRPGAAPPTRLARARGFVRRQPYLVAAIAAVLVLAVVYFSWSGGADSTGEPIVVTAERGDVEDTVTALGSLQPKDYVDVGAQVSGQLKTLAVQIGDHVQKGQFLAEIDSTVQAAKVQADRDSLRGLQAQLAEKVAQANLARAQAKRQTGLLKIGGTSRDAYQVAVAAQHSADAQVNAIKAQIAQAQSQLNGDPPPTAIPRSMRRWPAPSFPSPRCQGQTLNANQQAPMILRIADLSTMTVWTQVSEADVPKLTHRHGRLFHHARQSRHGAGTASCVKSCPRRSGEQCRALHGAVRCRQSQQAA